MAVRGRTGIPRCRLAIVCEAGQRTVGWWALFFDAVMDALPSVAGAASMLGVTSGSAFVYLTRILQETCMKVQECTNGEILLSVAMSRRGDRDGVLLYGSNYLNGE